MLAHDVKGKTILEELGWNVSSNAVSLLRAAERLHPFELSMLLAKRCDPAVRCPLFIETALHSVIQSGGPGKVEIVECLLRYGCPPDVQNIIEGWTALHMLCHQLVCYPLFDYNFDATLKTLELLAKAGDVNAKDHRGESALHILASASSFDQYHKTNMESLITTFLVAGANTALKNNCGKTALHNSLECGALNAARLLIEHTSTGITTPDGETPLHIASREDQLDIVAKLLEHGEDPNVQDGRGNTPLHDASAKGLYRTVSLLIFSPLAQLENFDGLTALQVAVNGKYINATEVLEKAETRSTHPMIVAVDDFIDFCYWT